MRSKERSELEGVALDGRYRIGRCAGIGGTGVVFEAERLHDGHPLVVKTLRPMFAHNPDIATRLRREGQVARAVRHPGIVPVLDEGRLCDGSPYLVMDRVQGESLSCLMHREGALSVAETIAIAIRVASVLHAAHCAGFVHRDVKPEHIVLTGDRTDRLQVQLLDFGVCAAADTEDEERERERGRVFGTPSYTSPEQASGNPRVDSRADVFALGVVMYEALSGRVPFVASDVTALLRRIIGEDAPRLGLLVDEVDPELDAVMARALSRDRHQRYPTMRALGRALAPWVPDREGVERQIAARVAPHRVSDHTPTAQNARAARPADAAA